MVVLFWCIDHDDDGTTDRLKPHKGQHGLGEPLLVFFWCITMIMVQQIVISIQLIITLSVSLSLQAAESWWWRRQTMNSRRLSPMKRWHWQKGKPPKAQQVMIICTYCFWPLTWYRELQTETKAKGTLCYYVSSYWPVRDDGWRIRWFLYSCTD